MPSVLDTTPLIAFADAIYQVLAADAVLQTLARTYDAATNTLPVLVATALPRDARTPKPYVVVGSRRELLGTGFAMGIEGGEAGVVVDIWSDFNGPEEVQDLQGRIRALILRDPNETVTRLCLAAAVDVWGNSLACADEQVMPEYDTDMPARSLFHGVQRFTADLEVRT